MRTVSYKRNSMISQSVGSLFLALLGLWAALQPNLHWQIRLLGVFFVIGLPVLSAALFLRWKENAPAISFDAHRLEVSTLFRKKAVAWSDVRDIRRETLTRSAAFGLIKQTVANYLVITTAEEHSMESSFRIQEDLLDWPKDAMPALADELIGKWSNAAHGRGSDVGVPDRSRAPVPPASDGRSFAPAGGRPTFGRKQI